MQILLRLPGSYAMATFFDLLSLKEVTREVSSLKDAHANIL